MLKYSKDKSEANTGMKLWLKMYTMAKDGCYGKMVLWQKMNAEAMLLCR
jgi:hypothetical protein